MTQSGGLLAPAMNWGAHGTDQVHRAGGSSLAQEVGDVLADLH